MSGIVYRKNNSNVSLTGTQYVNPATGTMRLCVRDVNGNIVKYGFTTNTSASQYSPVININGNKCYIGSKYQSISQSEETYQTYSTKQSQYSVGTYTASKNTYGRTEYTTFSKRYTKTTRGRVETGAGSIETKSRTYTAYVSWVNYKNSTSTQNDTDTASHPQGLYTWSTVYCWTNVTHTALTTGKTTYNSYATRKSSVYYNTTRMADVTISSNNINL